MNGRGRILGSETEWAMLLTEKGEPKPPKFFEDASEIKRLFFKSIPSPPRLASSTTRQSDFYGNGSRIYIDSGKYLEYATGEVMGALEAVIHEKAGERIVESAIANINEHPYFKERKLMLRSFKNNKDERNNTYGSHDNYCMIREKIQGRSGRDDTLLWLLAPFRISCQLFTGNGWLKEENGRLTYHLSQRAEEMIEKTGSSTTSRRAIINARDEPHADEKRYYRLHLIDRDALLAEPALFLKFGTTLLVLDMIESGFLTGKPFGEGNDFIDALHAFSKDPTLRIAPSINGKTYTIINIQNDFIDALHAFSKDPTLRIAPSINGKTYTIINIQEEYLTWASRFCETIDATQEQRLIIDLWDEKITFAKTPDPHLALAPFVDWAAKKYLLELKLEKLGYDWSADSTTELPGNIADRNTDDEEIILLPEQIAAQNKKNQPTLFYALKSMDFQFHENSPRGLARILEKRGFLKRIVSDKDIEYAIANPSPNTRALPRALWNKKLLAEGKNPEQIEVNWKYITCPPPKVVAWFPDPYDTNTYDTNPKFPVKK